MVVYVKINGLNSPPPHQEQVLVPLHATDFAGLGFTVAGTLRDGIFVKDVLSSGPAQTSDMVKQGTNTNSLLKPHIKYIFTDLILKVPSLKK